jgi:citrate lyase beta subunit
MPTLEAVVRPGLEGLVCPKVDTPEEVRKVDAILNEKEAQNELKRPVKLLDRHREPERTFERAGDRRRLAAQRRASFSAPKISAGRSACRQCAKAKRGI